jgi:hypothetical protein
LPGLRRGRDRARDYPAGARIDRRLAAFGLDLVVFAVAFLALVVAADAILGGALGDATADVGAPLGLTWDELLQVVTFRVLGEAGTGSTSLAAIVTQLVYLIGFMGYMVGGEAHFGVTVGKHALRLQVVPRRRGARRVGFQRALARNVCRIYDLIIPLWPLAVLDLGLALLTPGRRRSGDWFAGTMVIDQRDVRPGGPIGWPGAMQTGGRPVAGPSHGA